MVDQGGQGKRFPWYLAPVWTVGSSLIVWLLANLLDLFSVLSLIQTGGRLASIRNHPAEAFLIYGLLRALLTLAVPLSVAAAGRRWPWLKPGIWGALTLCALATAAAAWWRLYV